MTEPVRFPAYPIPEKWAELYGVFAAMFAGDWTLARQRWEASTKTPSGTYCTDCAGGIQYNFEQWQKGRVYPTQRTGISLTPGASPVVVTMQPNVCYLFGAGGDGNGSAAQPEGGVGIAGGVFRTSVVEVTLDQLPEQGVKAIYPVPVRGGDDLGIMILGDVAREVRVDIRL